MFSVISHNKLLAISGVDQGMELATIDCNVIGHRQSEVEEIFYAAIQEYVNVSEELPQLSEIKYLGSRNYSLNCKFFQYFRTYKASHCTLH